MHPPAEHRGQAPRTVRCAVFTVSDTRTPETDSGGDLLCTKLTEAGHIVVSRAIHRDEPALVRAAVEAAIASGAVDAVLTTGGTGLGPRDSTYEALEGLLDKTLPGFGELFRFLSYADIGAAAMLSRATAGVAKGCVVILLPGSPDAVRLAMDKLVVPELGHMVRVAR
jgi:molybdenum cofactor biosynthesis protein B